MEALLRRRYPLNGTESWRSLGDFLWESNNGVKFVIFSDIVISMTTLENKIMHTLAAKHLETYYNICLHRNAPQFASGVKAQNLFATMKKAIQSSKSPDTYIFGMSLKAASKDERMRFGFRNIRINNQYKLHIPIFVLKSIKCIERFGLDMDGIFIKPGNSDKMQELRTKISTGLEYNFDNYFHVYEVADLLKTYFRMMPEGIFTDDLESRFLYTRELEISVRIRVLNLLVQVLPQINREALFLLMSVLFRITRSRWSQVSSRILDVIFEPVLCRYNDSIIGENYGVIQNLIDYFPAIFGLQNKHLNEIYTQINILQPRKMSIHLKRRSMQCNDETSDILGSLKIFQASAGQQFDMIHNQAQAENNLNISSVRVPHPIRFNITSFATLGLAGPSASLGRPETPVPAEPAASAELVALDGPAATDGPGPVRLTLPVRLVAPCPRIEITSPTGLCKPVELGRFTGVPGLVGKDGLDRPSGVFATAELAGPLGSVGIAGLAGLAGPSQPAAPVGICGLIEPSGHAITAGSGHHSHQRESASAHVLIPIRKQDAQENIPPPKQQKCGVLNSPWL